MKLRELEIKDAEKMLKWMHDDFVVEKLHTNFRAKKIDDCVEFIKNCQNEVNIHRAIVDEEDEYLGTVSLKNICNASAEFAIVIAREAMGKGYAQKAMQEMIRTGFIEYGIERIYWCVSPDNARALRFYDKNGFSRVTPEVCDIKGDYSSEEIERFIWYKIDK